MQKMILLTLVLIMGFSAIKATANLTQPLQTAFVMKIDTIAKMYQQDVNNEGMDNPVVLLQYANPDLKAAMQREQEYFARKQTSCHVGYDVLWNSQDPDYTQDKQFSVTTRGLVQVSLAQGHNVYYELSCDAAVCQVADVILDEAGTSLRAHLLKSCS